MATNHFSPYLCQEFPCATLRKLPPNCKRSLEKLAKSLPSNLNSGKVLHLPQWYNCSLYRLQLYHLIWTITHPRMTCVLLFSTRSSDVHFAFYNTKMG